MMLRTVLVVAALLILVPLPAPAAGGGGAPEAAPIPVVFDMDIGGDIDDTWALAFLLESPELDVRLLVTDAGNPVYRAKIAARLLEVAGRTDIPIGLGLRLYEDDDGPQAPWVEGYDLGRYPGTVHEDGVQALIDVIMGSETPVTLIGTGAVPNVRAALEREPRIAEKARFVGMHGSLRRGYGPGSEPVAEANVKGDPAALQAVLAADWDVTLTPLDTCAQVQLGGERYQRVARSEAPLARAVMENYRIWWPRCPWCEGDPDLPDRESTLLFDTVAVYLAFAEDLLEMEDLGVRVTDDGFTVIDPAAPRARCATGWKDLEAFQELLVERLAGP
jgi:inosine-uridine nucleoside N-ribohydrolase